MSNLTSSFINSYCYVTISIIIAILFHFISSTSSLDIAIKPKTKENLRTAAILLSYFYKTFTLKQFRVFPMSITAHHIRSL